MPSVRIQDLEVNYMLTGGADAPSLVFSNSLGANLSMWDPQMPELEKQFSVLRCDTRGEGKTSVTPGPYTIEQLAGDVLRLMDYLGIERAHFCGLSMGGMIGMWLGLKAEKRFGKLALCNTAAKIGKAEMWNARIENVRKGGMTAVSAAVCERWFTPAFRVLRCGAGFRCARTRRPNSRSHAGNHWQTGRCDSRCRRPFARRANSGSALRGTERGAHIKHRSLRAIHLGTN
jgi:3-oxoadipate enol-lactonase